MSTKEADVLRDVPRGRKDNCQFVIDNTANVTRKNSHQPNRFWDDCGVWDSKQGRTLKSTFVRNGQGILQSVTQRTGVFCVKRRVKKKVTWEPIQPQPVVEDVVVLHSYYATLKADAMYRKRATWLESQPEIALVEYIGQLPEQKQPHGLAKTKSEFVRTQPRVIESMKVALSHRERPGQIYEDHVLHSESFEMPRNEKQVRNLCLLMFDNFVCDSATVYFCNMSFSHMIFFISLSADVRFLIL